MSPRCGWFGGVARLTCTVPTTLAVLERGEQQTLRRRSTSTITASNAARASSCENGAM